MRNEQMLYELSLDVSENVLQALIGLERHIRGSGMNRNERRKIEWCAKALEAYAATAASPAKTLGEHIRYGHVLKLCLDGGQTTGGFGLAEFLRIRAAMLRAATAENPPPEWQNAYRILLRWHQNLCSMRQADRHSRRRFAA